MRRMISSRAALTSSMYPCLFLGDYGERPEHLVIVRELLVRGCISRTHPAQFTIFCTPWLVTPNLRSYYPTFYTHNTHSLASSPRRQEKNNKLCDGLGGFNPAWLHPLLLQCLAFAHRS